MLTYEDLVKVLNYNPETGEFHWRVKPSKRFPAGMKAGSTVNGYVRIHHKDHMYGAHRLAWLYMYGKHPENQIDHINGNPSDNRIANLREATHTENAQNIRRAQKNNSHGTLGITYDPKKQLWRARIGINGKRIYIGKYKSQEEAAKAYIEAKRTMHSFNMI